MSQLSEMIKRHEGYRDRPYQDSVGKTTIGWGRNLTDNGITDMEAEVMLEHDIVTAAIEAQKIPAFVKLDPVRQDVLVSLVFNMGLPRLRGFKKMLAALDNQNFVKAADEMVNSKWAFQVGNRAQELAEIIRTGVYPLGENKWT